MCACGPLHQALHRRGHHTADLTTFLLNCYTKLKDVEKLERFINQDWANSSESSTGPADLASPNPATANGHR